MKKKSGKSFLVSFGIAPGLAFADYDPAQPPPESKQVVILEE